MKPLVSIPVPCHEDWNKMTPAEQGSYCASCKKVVRDFSTQSEEEINNYLLERRGKKVCGRFRLDQVVPNVKFGFSFELIPNFLPPLKKFALAVLFVFGASLFNITSVKGENVASFQIELSGNSISTNYHSVPNAFNKMEMDSIMSSYDSLVTLLRPIPYSDTDQTEIAEMPSLPDTSKFHPGSYAWTFILSGPAMGVCSPIDVNFREGIYGDIMFPEGPIVITTVGPVFDPSETEEIAVIPKPINSLVNSDLTEEKQKENEENDRKRDVPKDKRNNDLVDDSDFPFIRREKK